MNKEKPLVSIVVPCYNHESYVQDCIKSIIEQNYENIELIVIDDGSSDNSVKKIQDLTALCEDRFTNFEFRSRPNKGLCATLNEAIEWCSGKYYSAIASDDVMLKHKTELQVEFMEKRKDVVASFGGFNVIDADGSVIKQKNNKAKDISFEDIFLLNYSPAAPTQMVRLDSLRRAGKFPENLFIEDWYMWLRLSYDQGKLVDTGFLLAGYRKHDCNSSAKVSKMKSARLKIIDMYCDHPLHKKAKDRNKLTTAIELRSVNPSASLIELFYLAIASKEFFFNRRFYVAVIRSMYSYFCSFFHKDK